MGKKLFVISFFFASTIFANAQCASRRVVITVLDSIAKSELKNISVSVIKEGRTKGRKRVYRNQDKKITVRFSCWDCSTIRVECVGYLPYEIAHFNCSKEAFTFLMKKE